jgi:RNA methyltransferase, TrmH family
MSITSTDNQKLKEIRKLRMRRRVRGRAGRFVAEGEDLLAAADAAGWPPIERFCAAGSGLAGTPVDAKLLASASGLGSGTRTLAVYEERWGERPFGPLCLYLHGIHDPGNVGAILRSAHAFGAACVGLGPGSADPFGPKAVRASMGAIFATAVVRTGNVAELPGAKIALVAGSGVALAELCRSTFGGRRRSAKVRERGPEAAPEHSEATFLIGSEREGLPEAITSQADHIAHIPINTHSLNAAMAATVALYEATRMAPA